MLKLKKKLQYQDNCFQQIRYLCIRLVPHPAAYEKKEEQNLLMHAPDVLV